MIKLILTIVLVFASLHAKITIDFLSDKPKSNVKDFYIYQYLGGNVTRENACKATNMVKRLRGKLFSRAVKKCQSKNLVNISKCSSLKSKDFLRNKHSAKCLKKGFRVSKLKNVNKSTLKRISRNLRYKLPKKSKVAEVLASSNVFAKLIESNTATFFEVFNNVGKNIDKNI